MNLLDLGLLAGVAAAMGWGSKKGFIRMVMITAGLVGAIVIAVHHNDYFSSELAGYFQASALWISMIAFGLSSMLLFTLFRFAAKAFFRVASLQKLGRRDHFGGVLVGAIFGWFIMGYFVFLGMFLPLPYAIEDKIETSFLALRMGASVPFLYEMTAKLHPSQDNFVLKMEDSLSGALKKTGKIRGSGKRGRTRAIDKARVDDFLDRIDRYFVSGDY